jgi:hypothetical protein
MSTLDLEALDELVGLRDRTPPDELDVVDCGVVPRDDPDCLALRILACRFDFGPSVDADDREIAGAPATDIASIGAGSVDLNGISGRGRRDGMARRLILLAPTYVENSRPGASGDKSGTGPVTYGNPLGGLPLFRV